MKSIDLIRPQICLCDMHVTYKGKASPLMRYTNMSDSFKQLDKVGMLRYKEKLGMLGVTTDPHRHLCSFLTQTSKDVWPAHKVFSPRHITRAA